MENEKILIQKEKQIIISHEIVRFRGKITTMQNKTFLILLKNAQKILQDNNNLEIFEMSINDFINQFNLYRKLKESKSKFVDKLKNSISKIIETKFEFGFDKVKDCLFSSFKIENNMIIYAFSNHIRSNTNPNSKALIINDFDLFISFNSEHSRQLYKHIMCWKSVRKATFKLEDIKDYLGLNSKAYQLTNEVIQVINESINDINERAKMNIKFQTDKDIIDCKKNIEECIFTFK